MYKIINNNNLGTKKNMKKSLKKHQNISQNLINADYLAGHRISGCLPMVYDDDPFKKRVNEWFYNYIINKDLWTEEFNGCVISENSLYYI